MARDAGGPVGAQPVAQAGLGAGLGAGSQGGQAGGAGRVIHPPINPSTQPALLGVQAEHTDVFLQPQGFGSPGQTSSTPGCEDLMPMEPQLCFLLSKRSLELLKASLNMAQSNLLWWKVSLPTAEHWNEMILKVPPNPSHSGTL